MEFSQEFISRSQPGNFFAICEILSGSNFEEIKGHLKFIPSPGGGN